MENALAMDLEREWGPINDPARHERFTAVAFDTAEVRVGMTVGEGLSLIVGGRIPHRGAQVFLMPHIEVDDMPEYRRISVLTESSDHPVAANDDGAERYEISLPLTRLAGSRGIELVGAHQRKLIDLSRG